MSQLVKNDAGKNVKKLHSGKYNNVIK